MTQECFDLYVMTLRDPFNIMLKKKRPLCDSVTRFTLPKNIVLSVKRKPGSRMRLTTVANHGQYNSIPTRDSDGQYNAIRTRGSDGLYNIPPTTDNVHTPCGTPTDGSGDTMAICSDKPDVVSSPVLNLKNCLDDANGTIPGAASTPAQTPARSPSDVSESFQRFNPNIGDNHDHDLTVGGDSCTVTTTNTFTSTIGRAFDKVARRGRYFANRHQKRLVFKDGECNISKNQITKRKRHYFGDLFTTLLEMKWRYNLLLFGCAFVTSWLVFAFLWWLICIAHGDHLLSDEQAEQEHARCVANVYSFPTALLYSIETQHTIGYGSRMIEDKCIEAYMLLMIQSCFGVFIQSLLTGLIFAKLSRPKRRAKTMMFSKNGVICQRDGELFLLFRVGDMRKSPIIQTSIRAVMVKSRYTKEGELIPLCQYPLELETETTSSASENFILLSWPITVVHRINETSPLWEIPAEQLLLEQFEIVVILEGTIESTGMLAQMRTSYLPGEILWGHRFAPLFAFWKDKGQYQVDFTQFDVTIPIETPECSAKNLSDQRARATTRQPHHKESLFMSNFLTIPAVPYTGKPPEENHSPNSSIFKRMRSSLKRRRSERDRRRNGSLPSISFDNSHTADDMGDYTITDRVKTDIDEREIDVDVSVDSSRTENDEENDQ